MALTFNNLALTSNATGFSIGGGTTSKSLTMNNTSSITGTDGATVNIAGGGTINYVNQHPFAEVNFQGSSAFTLVTSGTFVTITPATTFINNNASFGSAQFSNPSNGVLTYIGNTTSYFYLSFSASLYVSANADGYNTSIFKNGVITNFFFAHKFTSNNVSQTVSFGGFIQLATNDVIDLRMTDYSANNRTITIETFKLNLFRTFPAL